MNDNLNEQNGTTAPQQPENVIWLGMPPAYVQAKPVWKIQPHDRVFAWLSLMLGFLFVRFVLFYADGFFTTGFFLLLYLCSNLYIRKADCKPRLPHRLLGAVICVITPVFSITAAPLLHGLCTVFLLLAIIWRTHAVCNGTSFVTRYFSFDLSDSVFAEPMRHYSSGPQALADSVKQSAAATSVKTVVLGLLVTLPLTVIVAALLASADSGVDHLLWRLGSLVTNNVMTTALQFGLGIPVGLWLFAMLYSAAQRRLRPNPMPEDAVYAEKLAAARVIPNLGLYAGVTPICLLYLLYVVSQTTYFLSAFAGRLPADTIYSAYARRGFFELCAIAVINLIVILVLTGCAKQGGKHRPKMLTAYAVLLCLFTLFIIATALAKMVLYISAYGLTALRVYTAWFMILLAVVFLVLLIRQFTAKLPTAAVLTTAFILLFGGLCYARPDARIAEYNIMRYQQGTLAELDVPALCTLSEDAYNVMARHPELLKQAGQWEYFLSHAETRDKAYELHKDRSWNIPAQILIQQLHTDTGHGMLLQDAS